MSGGNSYKNNKRSNGAFSAKTQKSKNECNKSDSSRSSKSQKSTSRFSSTNSSRINDTTISSMTTVSNLESRFLNNDAMLVPDMKTENGDQKLSYQLVDGGKLVKINRKNGDIVYMLRCVDGRRVYIEKTHLGDCLTMTNQKGLGAGKTHLPPIHQHIENFNF